MFWTTVCEMKWGFLLFLFFNSGYSVKQSCVSEFRNFLLKYNLEEENNCNYIEKKTWNYYVNVSYINQLAILAAQNKNDKFKRWVWNETRTFNANCLKDEPYLHRQLTAIVRDVDISVLSEEKVRLLNSYTNKMEENLAKKPKDSRQLNFSFNHEKVAYEWWMQKKVVGKANYLLYQKCIKIWNEACRLQGFSDCSKYWHGFYEDSNFVTNVRNVWKQVKPLYLQLHAYVRQKLIQIHGSKINAEGPIPVHFLGSKFGSNWRNIFNFTMPYPNKQPEISKDFIESLSKKQLPAAGLFKLCENFFVSLGLSKLTSEFWKKSLFQKPSDRKVLCYSSAWDFCDGKDFRIHQCTQINQKNFITAHHETGHIQYFMNYAHQPIAFRAGANPGFHEAVGDVIALSVMSKNYFSQFSNSFDNETAINFLYMMALEKLSTLPFSLIVDKWRWDLYSGKISVNDMNKKWWEMRLEYQGVNASFKGKEDDFELGNIIQVIKNKDYIRYFVSGIIQFQFYEGLCKASGHNGPLLNCNIYGSKAAGNKLREALRLGSSRPWPEVMHILTNGKTSKMDATALLSYFQPLYDWLRVKNQHTKVGWSGNN